MTINVKLTRRAVMADAFMIDLLVSVFKTTNVKRVSNAVMADASVTRFHVPVGATQTAFLASCAVTENV